MGWLWEHVTFVNVFLVLFGFVLLNQLWELYKLRGMPPGPRLSEIPFVGNFLSFDRDGVTINDRTRRFVIYCSITKGSPNLESVFIQKSDIDLYGNKYRARKIAVNWCKRHK